MLFVKICKISSCLRAGFTIRSEITQLIFYQNQRFARYYLIGKQPIVQTMETITPSVPILNFPQTFPTTLKG